MCLHFIALLSYKSPTDVVEKGEVLYSPMIRFQSFRKIVALDSDLQTASQRFLSIGETGRPKLCGGELFPFPSGQPSTDKTLIIS